MLRINSFACISGIAIGFALATLIAIPIEAKTFRGGRLVDVAFSSMIGDASLRVRASSGSISQISDIFAAADSDIAIIFGSKKMNFSCSSLSIQLNDSFVTCDLDDHSGKTVTVSMTKQTIRYFGASAD